MPLSSIVGPSSAKKLQTPKAKRKGKKKEEEAKRKVEEEVEENEAEFQKALLEVRVNELETLNLGLKKKSDYLETQNSIYKTQLQELRIEKEELVGYLEKSWNAEKTTVNELEVKFHAVTKTLTTNTASYERQLLDKHLEFEEMKTKLEKQIQDLRLQLTAVDDFRIQKDNLTRKLQNLENALQDEKKGHELKYEELENEVIRYRDKITKDARGMLIEIAKDVQKAGKLCLTGAVKAAIAANVKLREELETVSKDNLNLRARLATANTNYRKAKITAAQSAKAVGIERQRGAQYKEILRILLDNQTELDQRIKNVGTIEKVLMDLQRAHSHCKTEQEIQELVRAETETMEKRNAEILNAIKIDRALRLELGKLQDLILNFAITAKELTEARDQQDFDFLCQRFKGMIGKVHETACGFQHLSPTQRSCLVLTVPKMLPYVAFR